MKKILIFSSFLLLLFSCKEKNKAPDVSGIDLNVNFQRFDNDFFAIDTNNIPAGIQQIEQKYPQLSAVFLRNILGLDSTILVPGVKRFLRQSNLLKDTVNDVFKNTDGLKKDFEKAFKYIKYYFSNYKTPAIATIIGPVDLLAQTSSGFTPDFLGPGFMGISLQFYLGKNFSVYNDPFFIESVAPLYRSRRFSKEYILPDAMQLVIDDIFPDKSKGKPLVEQMIEKGKQWYMLDKILPTTADSLKTGYTQEQLKWCTENEGLIWTYIVKNEDLYSLNPTVIQTYIGEGPFTQGFSQENSPGNLGQWIGWQIVKKYVAKNAEVSLEKLMQTPARQIIDEAKYKPK